MLNVQDSEQVAEGLRLSAILQCQNKVKISLVVLETTIKNVKYPYKRQTRGNFTESYRVSIICVKLEILPQQDWAIFLLTTKFSDCFEHNKNTGTCILSMVNFMVNMSNGFYLF